METSGESDDTTQKQFLAIRTKFRITAAVALAVLVLGATYYHFVEGFRWLDSFYFCTITLTTIGYGDFSPKTDPGKLFTIFYVLAGVGIIATFANLFLQKTALGRQVKREHRKQHLDQ